MALGDLAKLASEALLSSPEPAAAPSPQPLDNLGAQILAEIAAMQRALKEDEELVVSFHGSAEKIRVTQIFLPTPKLAVLTGFDTDRTLTRVVTPVEALQLVAKPAKVAPGGKPLRVGLAAPKPKEG